MKLFCCFCCIRDNWVFVICRFLASLVEMGSCFGEGVQFEEHVKGERNVLIPFYHLKAVMTKASCREIWPHIFKVFQCLWIPKLHENNEN